MKKTIIHFKCKNYQATQEIMKVLQDAERQLPRQYCYFVSTDGVDIIAVEPKDQMNLLKASLFGPSQIKFCTSCNKDTPQIRISASFNINDNGKTISEYHEFECVVCKHRNIFS